MPVEAHGFILCQDENLAEAAVHAVREREIDDPIDAAERHGRLGSIAREGLEPRSFAPRENHAERVAQPAFPFIFLRHAWQLPLFNRPARLSANEPSLDRPWNSDSPINDTF